MEPAELTRRREALGLSRADLAERIGVTTPTVWRWEARGVTPIASVERILEQTLTRLERRTARSRAEPVGGYVSRAEVEAIVLDMMSPPQEAPTE